MDRELILETIAALERDVEFWEEQLTDIEAGVWRLEVNHEDVTDVEAKRIAEDVATHKLLIARYKVLIDGGRGDER